MAPIDGISRNLAPRCAKSRSRAPGFAGARLTRFSARKLSPTLALALVGAFALPACADEETPIFPRIRSLSISSARALAMKRAPALSLSAARVAAARGDEREVSRRFKVNTAGGLDPFSGRIRFYLALDLERLAGLNRSEKQSARQKVEQERITALSARQDAMKRVSAAWYGLSSAQMSVEATARRRETAQALYVAADARFKAGQGELAGVLSAVSGTSSSEDAYQAARQSVALSCLDLAQSCGYLTAEELETTLDEGAGARENTR